MLHRLRAARERLLVQTAARRDVEAAMHRRGSEDEEEEKEQDRKARLRVGAFGATDWVLSGYPSSCTAHVPVFNSLPFALSSCVLPGDKFSSPSHRPSGSEAIGITSHDEWLSAFANPALWTSLYPGKTPPFVDTESFGFEQPVVRKSAWNLLQLLVQKCKGEPQTLVIFPASTHQ